MLSTEQNEILTRVGPDDPMGRLLRRYWHPIAASAELQGRSTKKVRILGEDLALYRDARGELGLLHEQCPHRHASLAYGIPEEAGLRCMYHGWLFGPDGQCLQQPNEPEQGSFAERIRTTAYPVQELGGLVFAYLGPGEPPVLPRWDLLTWGEQDRVIKQVGFAVLPCNWLQIMENSVDPIHGEWLHGRYAEYLEEKAGAEKVNSARYGREHEKIGFDVFEWGIIKRRVLKGHTEDDDDWKIGHPLMFPNFLKVGGNGRYEFQYRVPVDDTSTLHVWYQVLKVPSSIDLPHQDEVPSFTMPYRDENGMFLVETVNGQDIMAWITQGAISDRTKEHLGSTDKGVILYRKLLREQLAAMEAGEDPMGVIRKETNDNCIPLPMEEDKLGTGAQPRASAYRSWRTASSPEFKAVVDQIIEQFA